MSLLSRLARLHGRTARRFCSELGLTFEHILGGAINAIEELASLAGIDAEALNSNTIVRTGFRRHVWRGQSLAHLSVSRLAVRICPKCIMEDVDDAAAGRGPSPYARTIWQLKYVRTCERHQVLLVSIAPSNLVSRYDFLPIIDPILPDLKCSKFPITPRETSDFERYLVSRIDGQPDPKCPWLNNLGFAAAADACEAMGAVLAFGRRPGLNLLDDKAWHLAGELGFLVGRDGPPAIREMLSAWDSGDSEGDGPDGTLTSRWGTFRTFLNRQDGRSDLGPVRDVAFAHVVATMPVGPGDVVLRRTVTRRLVHSLKTASRETGLSVLALRSLLRDANLIDPSSDGRVAKSVTFDAAEAQKLLEASSNALTTHKLPMRLAIGGREARALVAAGHIPPLADEADRTSIKVRTFAASAVDDFLRRLTAGAHPVRSWKPDVCSIARAAGYAGCDSMKVVDLILKGAFSWVGMKEGRKGYAAVLVRVSELKRLISAQGSEVMTLPEVAEELGHTYDSIVRIIRTGLMAATPARGSGSGHKRLVMRDEVSRFRQTYVTLGETARLKGMHPTTCRKALANKGIKSVVVNEGCRFVIYRRLDVSRE